MNRCNYLKLIEVHTDNVTHRTTQPRACLSENLAFGRPFNIIVTRTSNQQTRKQRKWLALCCLLTGPEMCIDLGLDLGIHPKLNLFMCPNVCVRHDLF